MRARAANGTADAGGGNGATGTRSTSSSAVGHRSGVTHTQKVDRLPVGADDETKCTNETGTVVPLLEGLGLDIAGRTFTADALLTQRKLAAFLRDRGAHFVFTSKAKPAHPPRRHPAVLRGPRRADFREPFTLKHGRLEAAPSGPPTGSTAT